MKLHVQYRSVLLALCGAAAISAGVAHAQSTDQPARSSEGSEQQELEEVVVSGRTFLVDTTSSSTKLSQPLEEVAQSISVIDESLVRDLGRDTYVDVLRFVPGVSVTTTEFAAYPDVTARSYGIGYKINAFDLADPKFIDNIAVERVEVVRGASGTTFGASGPGGYVNLITKRGTRELDSRFGVQLDNHNRYRAEALISGPVALDGRLRGVIGAAYEGRDTFRDRDNAESASGYASFDFDANDRLSFAGIGYYSKDERGPWHFGNPLQEVLDAGGNVTGYRFPEGIDSSFSSGAPWTKNEQEVDYYLAEVRYAISDRANVALLYSQSDTSNPSLGSDVCCIVDESGNADTYFIQELYEEHTNTLEARLFGNFSVGTRVSVEYLLNAQRGERGYLEAFSPYEFMGSVNLRMPEFPSAPPFTGIWDYSGVGKSESDSVGLTTVIDVGERISLTTGVRRDSYDVSARSWGGFFETLESSDLISDNQTSYRAAVSYELIPGLRAYYSYNESFDPGRGRRLCSGDTAPPFTADIHEVGVKYKLTPKLLATLALYEINTSKGAITASLDECETDQIVVAIPSYETDARGAELELVGSLLPDSNLSVIASYAFLDAMHPEPIDLDAPLDAANRADVTPPGQPKHRASLYAIYDFIQAGWLRGVSLGGGFTYEGNRDLTGGPDRSTAFRPGSDLVWDVSAYYRPSQRWNASLIVSNLFDRDVYDSFYSLPDYQNFIRDPRTATLRIEVTF